MDLEIVDRILAESKDLSTLPQIMTDILSLARDESSTADDMAKVLGRDPTLSAQVLRLVNSPLFGKRERIGMVHEAVRRLGVRNVTAVALSASVYDMTANWQSSLDRKRFWRHSLETAIAARLLAETIGYRVPEELFAAGMLHDFGMLALEKAFPNKFAEVWIESQHEGNMARLEVETWGADHARIGQFLLERWNLPDHICQAVGFHHAWKMPDTITPDNAPSMLVRLAHLISKFAVALERRISTQHLFLKEDIRQALNIPALELRNIERELFSQTMKEADYLEMDVGTADEIMMETHQLLFEQYITVENLMEEIRLQQQENEAAKRAVMN